MINGTDRLELWEAIKDKPAAQRALVDLTRELEQHPEGWDLPCQCATCLSYTD